MADEASAVQSPAVSPVVSPIADPAPLGLAAFALTTFLLSAKNANWMSHSSGLTFLSYAFAYGGICQLLAGMWEFRNRNVFGATAFATYGGFWIGVYFYIQDVGGGLLGKGEFALFNHDLGWILLSFAVFNTYMLLMSTQVSLAVFGVFLTLELTEIVGAIANFEAGAHATPTGLVKVSGYIGILTAIVAWYTSAAGVANGMGGRLRLPVGKPLLTP
jgi:succinate-acetate transporter protein